MESYSSIVILVCLYKRCGRREKGKCTADWLNRYIFIYPSSLPFSLALSG